MALDLAQLRERLGIHPPESHDATAALRIDGVNTLALAGATDLCFAEGVDQLDAVLTSHAGVILVPEDFPALDRPGLLRLPRPRLAFFQIASDFLPACEVQGIHPSAVIDATAVLGRDVAVGACAVIAAGVSIGERSVIGPGCYLGPSVTLGADCLIEANVTLHRETCLGDRCLVHSGTVIGGDGFGFAWDGGGHRKIPQLGRVVIEEDVEIGCNACVDRATLGETRIGRGTKIDNLVQIAHNSEIGAHVILVSQAGVAGSSKVGTGTIVAGQVAISDHVEVGAGARIGGQSGVTKDIPAGASVFGTPARPIKETLRELAALAQLPALIKRIKTQERELERLGERLAALEQERLGRES